jgi:hypothetical protein
VDGTSILSLLRGEADAKWAQRTLFFHYPHHRNSALHSAVVQGDHKFFRFYERPCSLFLYDLNRNIGETENVAEIQPEVAARLGRAMDEYFASVDACLPKPNPNVDPDYIPFDPDAPEQDSHAVADPVTPPKASAGLSEKQTERQIRKEQRKKKWREGSGRQSAP